MIQLVFLAITLTGLLTDNSFKLKNLNVNKAREKGFIVLAKKTKRKYKKDKKGFPFWFSRISALSFVVFNYSIISEDLYITVRNYPVLFNFLIATLALLLTIVFWNKRGSVSGVLFIVLGLTNLLFNLKAQLLVSVLSISSFLGLIGLLYLFDTFERYSYFRKLKERAKAVKDDSFTPRPLRQAHAYYKEIK